MKKLFIYLVVGAIFSSCNLYKPGLVNTPLLESQHDGNVSVSTGRTFGMQASYSPINNLGVMASYSNAFPVHEYRPVVNEPEEVLVNTYNNQQYEFGLGYYKQFNNQYYFELYLGYGKGEAGIVNDYLVNEIVGTSNYEAFEVMHEQWFIQPTFAFKLEDNVSMAFSAKISNTTFYNFKPSRFFEPPTLYMASPVVVSVQPTMSLLFEEDWFRVFIQVGVFLPEERQFYSARWINGSIGAGINLNQLKKVLKEDKGDYEGFY